MSATVAVITRTKDRPLMLERAARSVGSQTYSDFIWIVVNDGGNEAPARAVLDRCDIDQSRIQFLSNPISMGMEAASNIGIRASHSDYIVIHDDDDTLHPEFLEETVSFLESVPGQSYGGVATGIEYVSEEICTDGIIVHDRRPFMDWVHSVDLAEMLAQNMITSNSFLYRRRVFAEIGGYNEDLPVLGDWFFNIEFLLHADIKILPRVLSYYHHRNGVAHGNNEAYSNSGLDQHLENAARCRNALIRKYRHESGIAAAIVAGYFAHTQRHPEERGARKGRRIGGSSESFARDDLTEFDRQWVLSQVLRQTRNSIWFIGKKQLAVDPHSSLSDLARLAKDRNIRFGPPPGFDEARYLTQNPDVAAEVGRNGFRSGYEHYVLNGHLEGRNRPQTA